MLEIYYAGGSGGNLLLHLILLSKQHICVFEKYPSINPSEFTDIFTKVFAKQWDINGHWGDTEYEVDNIKLSHLETTQYTKIKLECMFGDLSKLEKYKKHIRNTKNTTISIQTDEVLLKKMINLKNRNTPDTKVLIKQRWNVFYNNIRDNLWPFNISLSDCNTLSSKIKTEIINNHILKAIIDNGLYDGMMLSDDAGIADIDLKLLYSLYDKTLYNNDFYSNTIADEVDALNRVTIANELSKIVSYNFLLSDVIQTGGLNVCERLYIPHTIVHRDFVNKWIELHPPDIKEMLHR